jgi:hypothetical protein
VEAGPFLLAGFRSILPLLFKSPPAESARSAALVGHIDDLANDSREEGEKDAQMSRCGEIYPGSVVYRIS